ncbi:5283_t:CDS:10 [Diversispora eburnea]|uniref:5283_t:CDS:1 n=1 Tax=Diversispora eburnea TaxID=1213867 RepID=A0A9N8V1S6_9GLOM|nr:5283_t:CDS:10 [Diversispora eburnea]
MSNLKDLLKEVNNAVISSSPQSVIDLIEDFKGTTMDREKTEKVSAGLLNIFKSVRDHSQKLDTYFKCFRALIPILGPDIIISELWDPVLVPILHSPFQPKYIVEEVKGITRDILTNETERVITFRKRILEIYLKESSMVGKAAGQDQGEIGEQIHAFWYRNLNNILRSFGGVKTKDFFDLLNSYFIQKQYRLQVLSLLTEFIRSQNLYIHQILETPLLDSLFKSLQRDTSTTIISLSLTALIMLLPHICISVVPYLPRLYTVFIRILLWDKHNFGSINSEGDDYELIDDVTMFPEVPQVHDLPKINITNDEDSWDQCGSDPTTWFKERNFPSFYEGIGDAVIRSRSMPLLRRHTLHPNLILSDSQKELSDTSRWMKVESADVVAECVELKELEDTTTEKVRRVSQSISMQEIVDVHKALKSGVDIVVGDDPWASKIISYSNVPSSLLHPPPSLPLPSLPQESPLPQKTQKPLLLQQASISFLQREIMLLRNELNFELYLKQQYLQHIGRLHRDHILDSRVEAEHQNLYITYRNLRVQLDKTKEAFNRQKDETASIKKKHIKWEDELKVKLRKYRNEANERKSEIDKLEQELREAKLTINIQAKQIEESNAKNFKLESEIKVHEPQIQKLNEYKNQINQLTKQLVIWESDSRKFQEQKLLMETLVGQWHKMEFKLESSEVEIKSLKSLVRDKRDNAFKKLEIQYEKVTKRNEELEWRNMELLARVESR